MLRFSATSTLESAHSVHHISKAWLGISRKYQAYQAELALLGSTWSSSTVLMYSFFLSDLLEHMARLFHQALKSVLLKSMDIKQFEIASYRTIVLFGDIINDDFIFGKRQFHEKKVEVYLFGFCCLCGSDFAVKKP